MGQELYEMVRRRLDEVSNRCAAAITTVTQMGGFGKYVAALGDVRDTLRHLRETLEEYGIDAVAEVVRDLKFPAIPSLPTGTPAKEVVQGREFEAEVRARERQWIEAGVRGVPFVVVDNKYAIEGAQSPEAYEQALRRIAGEAAAAPDGSVLPRGVSRDVQTR